MKKDEVCGHCMKEYVEEEKFSVCLTPTLDGSEIPVVSCLKIWNSFLYNLCLYFRYYVLLRMENYVLLIWIT